MRYIVFFDKENIGYLDVILNYKKPEFEITRIYYAGPREDVINLSAVDVVGKIDTSLLFDGVIILCDATDVLMNHLAALLSVNDGFDIWGLDEVEKNLLTKEGLMFFIENKIRLKCPEVIDNTVHVGKYSYYEDVEIEKTGGHRNISCRIGSFCSIAPGLKIILEKEKAHKRNSLYAFDNYIDCKEQEADPGEDIIIGNDVWIGANVMIMCGTNIGDGCIIGARAVVGGTIKPYSVVIGNPGKVVRMRFSEDKIAKLMEMKWWDWEYRDLSNALSFLQNGDCDSLYQYYEKNVKQGS